MRPTSRPWHRRHRRICMEGKVVQRLDPTDQHSTEELGRPWHKPPITSTCPASFNSWILGLKQFVAHPKQLGKEQSVSFVGPPQSLYFGIFYLNHSSCTITTQRFYPIKATTFISAASSPNILGKNDPPPMFPTIHQGFHPRVVPIIS